MRILDHIIPSRKRRYEAALELATKRGLREEFLQAYAFHGNVEAALEEWDLIEIE